MCNSLSPTKFVTVYQIFQRSRENYKILGEHNHTLMVIIEEQE